MARKLEPDYIKWVLTLNATQAQEEFHKLEKKNKELQQQTNASRKAMAQLEAEGKRGSAEWKNLRKSIEQNNKAMSLNRARMDEIAKRFDLNSMSVNQLKKRLKELQREFNNTSKATDPKRYNELRGEINKVQAALDKANAAARGLQGGFFSLTKMKQTMIGFFNGVGLTIFSFITGAFKNAFNLVVVFEKANSKLAAILGTSRDGIKEMTAAARQLGATTSYSAAEVTNLQIELAKLGFSREQILAMESATLKFAKAVDTDLPRAAAFAGAALRIFHKDAKDTESVLATFAIATTKTALDFSKLEASLSTVGPVAHAFGLSLEDTTALLGQLANAGFDASSAATATRNIILNLCDANGALAKALGGPVRNADDLAKGLQKLNAEGVDLAKALDLTDKRSVAAFSTFLSEADSLVELRDAITGVNDEFNEMSATMSDNVAGAIAGLKSAAEELVLKIAAGTEGPIKDLIKMLTSLVQTLGNVYQFLTKFSGVIKLVVSAIVGYKLGVIAAHAATKLFLGTVRAGKAILMAARAATILLSTGFKAMVGNIKVATTSFQAFKAALASVPWTAVIGGIAAIISAFFSLRSGTDETTKASDNLMKKQEEMKQRLEEHARKREEFTNNLATEKAKLLDLLKVAEDENAAKNERLKAIAAINKVCPEYNGHLDEEGRKLVANKIKLDKYIESMEKRMRLAYYKDEYEQYVKENEAALARQRKAQKEWDEHKDDTITHTEHYTKGSIIKRNVYITEEKKRSDLGVADEMGAELYEANKGAKKTTAALNDFIQQIEDAGFTLTEVLTTTDDTFTGITGDLDKTGNAAHTVVDEIKELKKQLKELRKLDPQTDEEYDDIKDRKKKIQDRLKVLEGKAPKNKHTPGTYQEDSIDEATAAADDLHQQKLLDINKLKGQIPEYELAIKKNEELIRYCKDLTIALQKLKKETDETHTATIDKINAEQNKVNQQVVAAQQDINKATAQKEQEEHKQRLAAQQAFYDTQERTVRENVIKQKTTREAADIYLLNLQKGTHEAQLEELQDFYEKTKNADYLGAEEKRQLLEKTSADIASMQSQVLTDTGKYSELLREMMTDTTSADGIKNSYELQKRIIKETYDENLKTVKAGSDEAVALEREKLRRIAALNYSYQEQVWQLQELTGLSWADEYDRELAQLENYHTQGLIKEKDYQKQKLQLGVNNAKKYFDYYSQLSGSMFSAIQDAEIAKSDAKYDVLIQQAKNNGEDTAALEEEKENKKLEIQKKYADVNFAIKASQIIADTAVAVIKTFAEMGYTPWGIAAAAMMSATGIAQVATAKAERDKIKNMQPGNTAGGAATQPAKAERVLTGYSEGGYTGDGDRYEVAGVVHRGEYVVPKPIMNNPRVVDAVSVIEAIRRNKTAGVPVPAGTPAAGYAEGGYTSATPLPDTSELTAAIKELRQATRNIRAYVVLRDIERAQESLDRARNPFTRKK